MKRSFKNPNPRRKLTGMWGLSNSCGATATAAVDVADVAIVRRERRSRQLCLGQEVQQAKPVRRKRQPKPPNL